MSKKLIVWVRPGVLLVKARRLRPVSALIALDLPTLERPQKAISGGPVGGSCESLPIEATYWAWSKARMTGTAASPRLWKGGKL